MRTESIVIASALLLAAAGQAAPQEKPAPALDTAYTPGKYEVFTGGGRRASIDDVVREMRARQVVFIGETHDDPTGHMLELELLKRATLAWGSAAPGAPPARPIALSLEFFERDVQLPLDEYLAGRISETSFRADTRPWERYPSDYRPLVEFAKEHGIPVIAANAPRRYVTKVTREGRESLGSLSPQALSYLAPIPYGKASPAYRDKWIATISEVMEQEGKKCGVPVPHADAPPGSHRNMTNQLDSQVLWDATMASSVARYLQAHPDALVLHMVGGFHVERDTGTPEQLRTYVPGVRSMIVSLRPVEKVDAFQSAPAGQWGDFVVQTDKSRTLEEIECRHFRAERSTN